MSKYLNSNNHTRTANAAVRLQHRIRGLLLVVSLSLSLGLVACGGGGPEGAATAWLDALNKGNIDQALDLSTEQTKALLSLGNGMGQDMAIGDYKIVSVTELDDTRAEVVVSSKDGETKLDLRKVDGKWKVGFKK